VLTLHETLDDGTEELKRYAPGYGNVSVRIPGVEAIDIVYALPNDALDAPRPDELGAMLDALREISITGSGEAGSLRGALASYRARGDAVPDVLLRLARARLDALAAALGRGYGARARMVALDLEQTVLDLARLYRARRPVDLEVLDFQARRMAAAAEAGDAVAAATTAAIASGVSERNATRLPTRARCAAKAADAAADDNDLAGIVEAAAALRAALR
jgi:hypothetical protein